MALDLNLNYNHMSYNNLKSINYLLRGATSTQVAKLDFEGMQGWGYRG